MGRRSGSGAGTAKLIDAKLEYRTQRRAFASTQLASDLQWFISCNIDASIVSSNTARSAREHTKKKKNDEQMSRDGMIVVLALFTAHT